MEQQSPVDESPSDPGPTPPSLSPSRAADFVLCALRYRYRHIDKLPEPVSRSAVRGTLVHRVLELVFDLEPTERTLEGATSLLPGAFADVIEAEPAAAEVTDDEDFAAWWDSASALLGRYFELEEPSRLEPADRELALEHTLDSGLVLRGIVDRLDAAADGRLRIVDYKTGRSPGEAYESAALFQMKFYALLIQLERGIVPELLQLHYLADGTTLSYSPDEHDLSVLRRKVEAIAQAIKSARESDLWLPQPGRHCRWCNFAAQCPAQSGQTTSAPADGVAQVDQAGGQAISDD